MSISGERLRVSNREKIILVCAILLALPLLIISIYSRPQADDYDYAILTHEAVQQGKGILSILRAALRTDVRFYFRWQGLYTSAFLLSLQPAIFGEGYYCLAAPIIFLMSYLALWGAVHIVLKRLLNVTKCFSAIWAFWVTAVIFASMPSATEGLFWFNGAMNYTPWAFVDCLIIALVFEAYFLQGKQKNVVVACASVLAFIVSGANHVTAFENILLLFGSAVLLICWKRKFPVIPLACAVAGFLIMYIAPGTAIRQDCFSQPTVFQTVVSALQHTLEQLNNWCNLGWLLFLLSLTPLLLDIINNAPPSYFRRFPIMELVLSFGMICAMNCVPYYAMKNFGTPRLINVVWIAFLVCSIVNYTLLLGFLCTTKLVNIQKTQKQWTQSHRRQLLTFLVCTVLIFTCSNSFRVTQELLNGKAAAYAAEMDARIAKFNEPEEMVIVPPIQNKDCILHLDDITPDPDEWPNHTIGSYYGKLVARSDG